MEEGQQLIKDISNMPLVLQELTLMQGMKQYFSTLRQSRGHNPEGSPIDLEILLLLKLVQSSFVDPARTLHSIGIIVVNQEIAINANFLKTFLSTCRSRINNTMKSLKWNLSGHNNQDKFELLKPLIDRNDVRNWTIRTIPESSPVYQFIRENPRIQLRGEESVTMNLVASHLDDDDQFKKDGTDPRGEDSVSYH